MDSVLLTVRVTPRAGRDRIVRVRQGTVTVRLAAAPVHGAANDALVRLFADALKVPRRSVTLVSGERSRTKRIRIAGLAAADARLSAILTG